MDSKIKSVVVKDIRFPTSLEKHGSDAMHTDPDYSCAYVMLYTDTDLVGHGLSFTIGRGTEIVVTAVKSLTPFVVGRTLRQITDDFASFWRSITSESQIRWIGPEKGAIHLASSAIINAIWDLWARVERKPLWKLLVDMEPEKLVSTIDFRYITDALTKEEAIEILKKSKPFLKDREKEIIKGGYPAYTTQIGWLGYSSETVQQLCRQMLGQGFTSFKAKVGENIEDDKRRLALIRSEIGSENKLMVDANQRWDVDTAIAWMKELKGYNLLWIEEPTSPDDILGHAKIAQELRSVGIGVATGEQCQNRVIFKQLLQSKAISFCQIDSTRLGGVNEVMAVILMAKKFGVPVCPHAGGVGLCEYVQHLGVWDFIAVSGDLNNRMIEYVDHLHEHFRYPARTIKGGRYAVPANVGYCGEMLAESMDKFEFPTGTYWKSREA